MGSLLPQQFTDKYIIKSYRAFFVSLEKLCTKVCKNEIEIAPVNLLRISKVQIISHLDLTSNLKLESIALECRASLLLCFRPFPLLCPLLVLVSVSATKRA